MLPFNEFPLIWLTVFGVSLIVLLSLGSLVRATAHQFTEHELVFSTRLNIALAVWPLLAIIYALVIGLDFSTFPPMLAIPLIVGTIVMFQPSAAKILSHIPLYLLILIGTYRTAGAIFLYAYYWHDNLSYGFAFNAGWGDVLTGVLAPFVAYMTYKRMPGYLAAIMIWTVIGIGDLILAPISAGLYGAESLSDFPLNLIPLFLGPPFGILLHLIVLRTVWLQRSARDDRADQDRPVSISN